MKIIRPAAQLLSLILSAAVVATFTGCEKQTPTDSSKPSAESKPSTSGTPEKAAAPGKVASAEKNSFTEVTSQLDPGGNFFLYLSTEQWTRKISSSVGGFKEMVLGFPDVKDEDRTNVVKGFDVATRLIKDSGIEDVSGVGMSSVALEPGLYRTKVILHHYDGQGKGFLWNLMGSKPHALTGLNLLPTNTVLATFSDVDVSMLWSTIQSQVKQSGFPEAEDFLAKLPWNFEQSTGLKWDKVVGSLGGEFGFVMTFDESKQIPVPLPSGEGLQFPEPGIMLVIKVNDSTIFDRVDKAITDMGQQPVVVNEANLKMRTVPLPLPVPIELRPTIALSEGYLFIASTDQLVQRALAVKAGKETGLKTSAEFTRISNGVPTEGNQFFYISPRLGQKITEIQRQALSMKKELPESATKFMQSWLDPNRAGFVYSVSSHTSSGWVSIGNSSHSAGPALMAAAVVAPVGLLAGIAVPNFVKARTTAQKNACINNLRQIDGAKQQWALEKKKEGTEVPTQSDLAEYLKHVPVCPAGGEYTLGAVDKKPECSHDGHALPE